MESISSIGWKGVFDKFDRVDKVDRVVYSYYSAATEIFGCLQVQS